MSELENQTAGVVAAAQEKPAEEQKTLDDVIRESKANIAAQELATPPKRKRGRPPGSGKKSAEGAPTGAGPALEPQVLPTPNPQMKAILAAAVGLPFQVAADRLECPAVALKPEEADGLGEQLDLVIQHYFPNLGEASPAAVLGVSLAVISLTKYAAYQEHRRAREAAEAAKTPSSNQPGPGGGFFPSLEAAAQPQ